VLGAGPQSAAAEHILGWSPTVSSADCARAHTTAKAAPGDENGSISRGGATVGVWKPRKLQKVTPDLGLSLGAGRRQDGGGNRVAGEQAGGQQQRQQKEARKEEEEEEEDEDEDEDEDEKDEKDEDEMCLFASVEFVREEPGQRQVADASPPLTPTPLLGQQQLPPPMPQRDGLEGRGAAGHPTTTTAACDSPPAEAPSPPGDAPPSTGAGHHRRLRPIHIHASPLCGKQRAGPWPSPQGFCIHVPPRTAPPPPPPPPQMTLQKAWQVLGAIAGGDKACSTGERGTTQPPSPPPLPPWPGGVPPPGEPSERPVRGRGRRLGRGRRSLSSLGCMSRSASSSGGGSALERRRRSGAAASLIHHPADADARSARSGRSLVRVAGWLAAPLDASVVARPV
jgi:hypothetical protein